VIPDVVFARPAALYALAVALPVLLAHLYRRRRRRVAVAFVPLLREAVGPVRARGAWKRVREALRLTARLGAVAALALALAGPRPARPAAAVEDLVVVVDADPTTTARERRAPYATRLDDGLALAQALVRAHPTGRVGVLVAGHGVDVLLPPTDDRDAIAKAFAPEALRAVLASRARRAPDLGIALGAARAARAPDRPQRLVVVSARALDGLGDDVAVLGAGATDDDRGFVAADVEARPDGATFGVRVVVRNVAAAPFRGAVRWRWEGGPSDAPAPAPASALDIGAGAEATVAVEVVPPRAGAHLVGTLDGDDAWDGNDAFAAWLAPVRRPSVLVVHGGAPRPFLRAVLEAMGDAIDRDASGFVEASRARDATPRDVTIVDGAVTPPRAAARGARVFLAPFAAEGPPSEDDPVPFQAGRTVAEPLVWRVAASDPLLRGVDLSTAYVARGVTIVAPGAEVLASVEGEAVVARGGPDAAPWLAFGLDPDGSDLPLRAALPLLLRNALRRFGEAPLAPFRPFYRDDEPLAPRVPVGVLVATATSVLPLRGPAFALDAVTPDAGGDGAAVGVGARRVVLLAADGPDAPGLAYPTARVPLSRGFDVRPVRPVAPRPPPAPPPPEDVAAAWLRRLLLAAGGLLAFDVVFGALRKKIVAAPSRRT